MGGVRTYLALVLALACVCQPAHGQTDSVRALVREKAAAVAIMRDKARRHIGILAQDRVFGAFLNASTQSEGLRVKARIEAAFGALNSRFGLRNIQLIARDGLVVARTAASEPAPLSGPALAAAFELQAMSVSTRLLGAGETAGLAIAHLAPVVWRGNREFVLRGEQSLGAYRNVLKAGVGAGRYVALIDEGRTILSEAGKNPAAAAAASGKFSLAGYSLEALRRALKGSAKEGYGEISSAGTRLAVGYQAVGPWTVVAVETAPIPHRCPENGARICG
jgi:hypothetical protein